MVVLPAPLGPSSPKNSPCSISRLMPSSANSALSLDLREEGYALETDWKDMAGIGTRGGAGDGGASTESSLAEPADLLLDRDGAMLVWDRGNHRIRRLNQEGDPAPLLEASQTSVRFAYSGGPNPSVAIDVAGYPVSTALAARAVPTQGNWLSLALAPSELPATVRVNAALADSPNGDYSAMFRVVAGGASLVIPVAASVRRPQSALVATPSNLTFNFTQGGSVPSGQPLSVSASQPLSISAEASATWLRVSPANVATSGIFSVSVNPSGLPIGSYEGTVTLTAAASNSPLLVAVTLRVAAALPPATPIPIANNNTPQPFAGIGGTSTAATGDGGPALQAGIGGPSGVAVDRAGNVYVSEIYNHRVRRIAPNGIITIFAGTGQAGVNGDGGPATQAQLTSPTSLAVDPQGNLYISEPTHRVRRVATDGTITIFAGGNGGFGGDGGPATAARLNDPQGLAVDGRGNLYIADTVNGRIRKVDSGGTISTIASGLDRPIAVAADELGNVFFAEFSAKIWKLTAAGERTLLPGNYALMGGMIATATGNLIFAEKTGGRLYHYSPSGTLTNVAGPGLGDIRQLAFDANGSIYAAEFAANRVRRYVPGTAPAVPATFSVDRTTLTFTVAQGAAAPSAQTIALSSTPATAFPWVVNTITVGTFSWLRVDRANGSGAASVSVSVVPTGLPVGTYEGQLGIVATGLTGSPKNVAVRLTVTAPPSPSVSGSALRIAPSGLMLAIKKGGPSPSPQNLQVLSATPGQRFRIKADQPWVTVSPVEGVTPAFITVTVNTDSLPIEHHWFNLTATAVDDARNVAVGLCGVTVGTPNPAPLLSVSPSRLDFNARLGDPPLSAAVLFAGGSIYFNLVIDSGVQWAGLTSTPGNILVSVDTRGLSPGVYGGTLYVQSPSTVITALRIPVTLTVKAAGAAPVGPPQISNVRLTNTSQGYVVTMNFYDPDADVTTKRGPPLEGAKLRLGINFPACNYSVPVTFQDSQLNFAGIASSNLSSTVNYLPDRLPPVSRIYTPNQFEMMANPVQVTLIDAAGNASNTVAVPVSPWVCPP